MSALQVQALSDGGIFFDDTDACRCVVCGWLGFVNDLSDGDDRYPDSCPRCKSLSNGIDGSPAIEEGHGPLDWWEPETAAEGGKR